MAGESCLTRDVNVAVTPETPPAGRRRAIIISIGILAVAALGAYHNTFSAPFEMDDADTIRGNPTIRHVWPPWEALSPARGGTTVSGRPFLNLSFAVNYAISGEEVWSYHAFNLAVHFLGACALFGIIRRTLGLPLLRGRFGDAQVPLALAVAALWLLHPLQTESITYVSQRAESLAGLFCLLTLYGFIRAAEASGRLGKSAWGAMSWASCLLGMATKEFTVALPLLVLAYDAIFLGDGESRGLAAVIGRRRGYYLALASTWVLLGYLVIANHDRGGTTGHQQGLTPAIYMLSQCHAITVYLKLAFWPSPLVFDYGQRVNRHFAEVWPQALMLVCLLTGTGVALWRRSAAGFAGLWFFALLAPSSSILPLASQTMAEHRMYLPLAAIVALAVTGLFALLGRRSLILWPVLAVVLGWLTFERNETYGSNLALWKDTVAKAPHNGRAWYNLSVLYSDGGQYAQAIEPDQAGLNLDEGWAASEEAPHTLNKLGYDLAQLGRLQEAVARYQQALQLVPEFALAHLNLAEALVRLDRYPEAIVQYEDALRLKVGGTAAERELSDALMHEGRVEESIAHSRAAVLETPDWAPGYNNLAYALLLTGRVDESIAAYRQAVRLDPRYAAAWVGLSYALIQANRPAEAIAPGSEAVRLQPGFADARNTLGIAFARTGRTTEAIASFEQAVRLDPSQADVHNNLGNALSRAGRSDEAIAEYREALRRDPDYAPAHRDLGDELRRAGRESEAEEQFEEAKRLESAAPGQNK
jgi:tetratricopeptide (TPR) repeat protein